MKLQQLPKLNKKPQKRLGRGYGSGRGGHASTRGSKGQKSRSKIGIFFEGTKFKKSLIKRLPLMRGKGKFNKASLAQTVVNVKYLNVFKKGEKVDLETLILKGILPKNLPSNTRVKILGDGELGIPLTVSLPCSKGAEQKIKKAGGEIVKVEKK